MNLRLVEVGARDGLQNEAREVPTDAKIAFIDALSAAGVDEVEVTGFVHPAKVPQLKDAAEVFAGVTRRAGVVFSCLVPNERGLEGALAAKADKIALFTAASETFNRKNINTSIKGSIDRFKPVLERAGGLRTRAYISTAFWCPYEGRIKPEAVVEVAKRLRGLGLRELSIGDTIGKASADETRFLLDALLKTMPVEDVFLHFHDTYGRAALNAVVAFREFGVSGFDASAGGLGGCPYAPGAAGNVASGALVRALREAGLTSSVDADALDAAAGALIREHGLETAARAKKVP